MAAGFSFQGRRFSASDAIPFNDSLTMQERERRFGKAQFAERQVSDFDARNQALINRARNLAEVGDEVGSVRAQEEFDRLRAAEGLPTLFQRSPASVDEQPTRPATPAQIELARKRQQIAQQQAPVVTRGSVNGQEVVVPGAGQGAAFETLRNELGIGGVAGPVDANIFQAAIDKRKEDEHQKQLELLGMKAGRRGAPAGAKIDVRGRVKKLRDEKVRGIRDEITQVERRIAEARKRLPDAQVLGGETLAAVNREIEALDAERRKLTAERDKFGDFEVLTELLQDGTFTVSQLLAEGFPEQAVLAALEQARGNAMGDFVTETKDSVLADVVNPPQGPLGIGGAAGGAVGARSPGGGGGFADIGRSLAGAISGLTPEGVAGVAGGAAAPGGTARVLIPKTGTPRVDAILPEVVADLKLEDPETQQLAAAYLSWNSPGGKQEAMGAIFQAMVDGPNDAEGMAAAQKFIAMLEEARKRMLMAEKAHLFGA